MRKVAGRSRRVVVIKYFRLPAGPARPHMKTISGRLFALPVHVAAMFALIAVLIIAGYLGSDMARKVSLPVLLSPYSSTVSGATVIIDIGHGGIDKGAVSNRGISEAEVCADIARKLQWLLNRAAIYTVLTGPGEAPAGNGSETSDVPASSELLRYRTLDISRRCKAMEATEADLLVSIHASGFPHPSWSGFQTLFPPGDAQSRNLAEAIYSRFSEALGSSARTPRPSALWVFDGARRAAAKTMVEVGYLSNPREEGLLSSGDYRAKLAAAIYRGIISYLRQRNVVPPENPPSGGETPREFKEPPPKQKLGPNEVALYFFGATNRDDGLVREVRKISGLETAGQLPSTQAIATAALNELLAGPGSGSILHRTIPRGTTVSELRIAGKEAYVTLGSEIAVNHWGGSRVEELTILSIVNTLTAIEGIERVMISVGKAGPGDERFKLLAGHVLLGSSYAFGGRALAPVAGTAPGLQK